MEAIDTAGEPAANTPIPLTGLPNRVALEQDQVEEGSWKSRGPLAH